VTVVYSFGPFQADAATRRLIRDGGPVAVPERHFDILLQLLSHAGEVLSKNALIEGAWKDVAVTDNSLEQAISGLRRILDQSGATPYIETVPRQGYRFGVPVTRSAPRYSVDALEAMLAPHRAFVEGRAALETLERDAVTRARAVLEEVVRASPDHAPARVGLANALALSVEATRTEQEPDRDALAGALHHAGEACRLDPSSAEAWSVLGLALHQSRDAARAVAAAQRAIALEPGNWRHHLRLSYVAWGEERLRHAERALQLFPGVALAHWLAATVYIARQAFSEAERALVSGTDAQDRQHDGGKFGAVGLHLLLGLLRLAQGNEASALEELNRELSSDEAAHIYTRQARANAWCAIAAIRLRQDDRNGALDAFQHAEGIMPGHPVTLGARTAVSGDAGARAALDIRLRDLRDQGAAVEAAFAEATADTLAGHADRAARSLYDALAQAPSGSAGWTVPVEPLLHVTAHPGAWNPVLALIRSRAA
jgi:DNA-binding winged helix-turn-helix (wHTH) protein